jgi:hypothetical protein
VSSLDRQCAGDVRSRRSAALPTLSIAASVFLDQSVRDEHNVAACGCAVLSDSLNPLSAGPQAVMQRIDEVTLLRD